MCKLRHCSILQLFSRRWFTQIYADLRLHLLVNFCSNSALFIPSSASRHFHSLALPLLTRWPLTFNPTPCAWLLDMWAADPVVLDCCRRQVWLFKYITYEILHHKEHKVEVTISLRTLRSLWWNSERQPSICVYLCSSTVNQRKSAYSVIVEITGFTILPYDW